MTDNASLSLDQQLTARLEERFVGAAVSVAVDGNRALVAVTAAEFGELSRVKRQQAVYAVIGDYVTSGALHAITIQASVPA